MRNIQLSNLKKYIIIFLKTFKNLLNLKKTKNLLLSSYEMNGTISTSHFALLSSCPA